MDQNRRLNKDLFLGATLLFTTRWNDLEDTCDDDDNDNNNNQHQQGSSETTYRGSLTVLCKFIGQDDRLKRETIR